MELFADLDRIIQGYLPADKIELIKRAFVIARDAHEGQFRSSGEPYITHPVAVASIIAQLHLDHEAVMAALLHLIRKNNLKRSSVPVWLKLWMVYQNSIS